MFRSHWNGATQPFSLSARMIVVHACWLEHQGLCLWAEDTDRTVRRGRRSGGSARLRPHPFAADEDTVWEAAEAIFGEALPWPAAVEPLTLHLPSSAGSPQASPGMAAGTVQARATGLAPWSAPSLRLAPPAALDLLLKLPGEAPRGLVLADSLPFWAGIATLALERVARGRVVPVLVREGEVFRARWRPTAGDDTDADRLDDLLRTLPPVCRAAAPGSAPGALLADAHERLTDACARACLATRATIRSRPAVRGASHAAVEAWLGALLSEDGSVEGAAGPLERLRRELDEWSRASLRPAPLRTCFRLVAPGETAGPAADDEVWRLEFLVQPADDPSLLVPAERVWRARGGVLRVLRRTVANPQERLLEDLGRAMRVYPELASSLDTARPTGLELDADGAYHFLREAAPLLAQAGFAVRVPSWWNGSSTRLGARLHARPAPQGGRASGLMGLESICEYRWEVALGDQSIPLDEFRRLARLKVPLVRIRGQWVELRRDEVEAALALFEKRGERGALSVADLMRVQLGMEASPVGIPVTGVVAEGWLDELLSTDGERRITEVPAPAGFHGSLRPYQARGLSWLAFLDRLGLGACLADDMGLGKTVQLLALLAHERSESGFDGMGNAPPPTLLVCPMSVVGNWQREAARFVPTLRVHVHHGGERLGGDALAEAVQGCDLVITTYALAARDREALAVVRWGRIVLDEAQNIKNSAAKQAQAVRSLPAPRRIAMTGTPVENRLAELWSIFEFLNPGLLGSQRAFRERFATPIERFNDEDRARRLRRLTGPFVLRRLKTDRGIIRDLPAKQEIKVFCNLTREQASLYQAVVDDMMARVESSAGIERKGLVLATMMKLKQVCNHPVQLLQDRSPLTGRSGKLERLEGILDEALAAGDRALVFTQFTEMGDLLRDHLQRRLSHEVLFLHGGTSKKARDSMVARFQTDGGPPVFLLSVKAGGTGLNLTAANHVVHFDRWWNPAVEDQASDRAYRIGQRRDVQVRKLICVGTLEERIDRMIEDKRTLAGSVVGAGEAWLTSLSTAELRDVVALSRDAVAE